MAKFKSAFTPTLLAVLLTIGGCATTCEKKHSDMSPEEVVEQYLNKAFNIATISDRPQLIAFTAGPLREALISASDSMFEDAYVKRRYELKHFAILERKDLTPREVEVTYTLTYKDLSVLTPEDEALEPEAIPDTSTETKVLVSKKGGVWQIFDVINKKTSFNFHTAPADTEIKPGLSPDEIQDLPKD